MRPRKYFWATMLVAFCDQVFGNSTPRCSNAGLLRIADHGVADLPLDGSRTGCTPASVKRLPTLTPSPAAVMAGAVALRLSGHDLSSCWATCWASPRGERPILLLGPDGPASPSSAQLIRARKGVVLVAPDHGLAARRGRPRLRYTEANWIADTGSSGRGRARRDRRSGSPRPPGRHRLTAAAIDSDRSSSCSELTGRLLAARSSPPRSFWSSNRSRRPSRLRTVTLDLRRARTW